MSKNVWISYPSSIHTRIYNLMLESICCNNQQCCQIVFLNATFLLNAEVTKLFIGLSRQFFCMLENVWIPYSSKSTRTYNLMLVCKPCDIQQCCQISLRLNLCWTPFSLGINTRQKLRVHLS